MNPQWVRLLDLLEMNVRYERCLGAELYTGDGRRILDFLSGYCVHNTGHNHPAIVEALKDELDRRGPAMLQSHVPELAAELAARLCLRAGGRAAKVFFCSSGSEGVEAAIKFSRAHTGRTGMLFAKGAFHGLTCGALSLMDNETWRNGFGPLLPQTEAVPFGSVEALERKLETRRFAAFVVEPIQGEAGIEMPGPGTCARPRSSAAATEPCWLPMKCKPACTVRGSSWPRIISISNRISSSWPKRSRAGSCRWGRSCSRMRCIARFTIR